jgi:hypothetical protein
LNSSWHYGVKGFSHIIKKQSAYIAIVNGVEGKNDLSELKGADQGNHTLLSTRSLAATQHFAEHEADQKTANSGSNTEHFR